MENLEIDELKTLIDEIRYWYCGCTMEYGGCIKKDEVSEDKWNRCINNLIFVPGSEGLLCNLYCKGLKVFSGMVPWELF